MSRKPLLRPLLIAVGLVIALGLRAPAWSQTPNYTVVDIAPWGDPYAVNKKGQVVGSGYLWDAATGLQQAIPLYGMAINSLGQIAGSANLSVTYQLPDGLGGTIPRSFNVDHPAFWDPITGLLDLGVPDPGFYQPFPGSLNISPFWGYAQGINDAGTCVGATNGHATLFSGGTLTDLGTFGGPNSVATGINNLGQVVGAADTGTLTTQTGTHAFLWDSTHGMQDLGVFSGVYGFYYQTSASAINDNGLVVGEGDGDGPSPNGEAAAWDAINGWQPLGAPIGADSFAFGVNNLGQIVGGAIYDHGDYFSQRAYLWDSQGMHNLNDLIPADSGWTLLYASGINDNGEIACTALLNGEMHSVLLRPVSNATPVGQTVTVTPSPDASLTFDTVSTAGVTTVTPLTNPPDVPPIYQNVAVAVEIVSTVPVADIARGVTISVHYDPSQFSDPGAVRLIHYVNGEWQDITTSVNTQNFLVCGQTTSFSPFALTVLKTVSWSGVLQPINTDGSSVFKIGSTIPVKFTLTGEDAGKTNLQAHLYVSQQDDVDPSEANEAISTSAADSGNTFRYDATAGQYVFNMSTKKMSQGTWYLRIDLGDGVDHIIKIKLKK